MGTPGRRWIRTAVLAWAVATAAGTTCPPAAADAEAGVVEGKRVRVEGTAPRELLEQAASLLDAAMPLVEAHVRRPAGDGKVVVHLYATADEYTTAVKAAGGESLAGNLAATLTSTKESYLAVQPRADAAYLALVGGLPEMTRQLLYHEVVHQVAARGGAPWQDWPDWWGEGMAEHVAALCLAAAAGRGSPPAVRVQDSAALVKEALAAGRMTRLDRVLHARQGTLSKDRRTAYYAHWGSLYGFLASDDARLARLSERLAAAGAAGSASGRQARLEATLAESLAAVYGPLDALAARWQDAVRAAAPAWYEPIRSTQRAGAEWVTASFPDSNAIFLRAEPPPPRRYALALEWNALDLDDGQADVLLAYEDRSAPRFLKLALRHQGSVTLLAYADGEWQDHLTRNADVDAALVSPGAWHRLRVVVDAARLEVEADGRRVLDASVPAGFDVLRGAVGLGAHQGVVRWRGLETKPLP